MPIRTHIVTFAKLAIAKMHSRRQNQMRAESNVTFSHIVQYRQSRSLRTFTTLWQVAKRTKVALWLLAIKPPLLTHGCCQAHLVQRGSKVTPSVCWQLCDSIWACVHFCYPCLIGTTAIIFCVCDVWCIGVSAANLKVLTKLRGMRTNVCDFYHMYMSFCWWSLSFLSSNELRPLEAAAMVRRPRGTRGGCARFDWTRRHHGMHVCAARIFVFWWILLARLPVCVFSSSSLCYFSHHLLPSHQMAQIAHNVLTVKPVLNQMTTYTAVMSPTNGTMQVWNRYCNSPCSV